MDRARVLVVEDDEALRTALISSVSGAGFIVDEAADGLAAMKLLRSERYDIILLDIGLPFVDGWQLLATVRGPQPAVVVISARGEEQDKVRALNLGADDYLAKPFGSDELLARLRAVLRRVRPGPGQRRVSQDGVTVDMAARAVFRDGVEVHLSPTEYLLLAELARQPGRAVESRTLLRRVWGPEYADERNYVRTFVQRLRSKLEADPAHPEVIVTVGRMGYRFGPAPAGR